MDAYREHDNPLTTPRKFQTATLLQNGQVLLAGGYAPGGGGTVTSSAELYNPATGTWAATGSMTTARIGHTATLLPNGQVLVAGGAGTCVLGSCPIYSSAELYHPATGTWTTAGSMNFPRSGQPAWLLPNGQVLVRRRPGSSHMRRRAVQPRHRHLDPRRPGLSQRRAGFQLRAAQHR